MEIGNLAEALSAIGTVGAFVVTYLLLRHESESRDRAQASHVASWAEARPASEACGYFGVDLHLLNANAVPIFDCQIVLHTRHGDRIEIDHGTVPPSGHVVWPEDASLPGWADDLDHLQIDDVDVELRFTDSAGQPWRRKGDGHLERMQRRPDRVMLPYRG